MANDSSPLARHRPTIWIIIALIFWCVGFAVWDMVLIGMGGIAMMIAAFSFPSVRV